MLRFVAVPNILLLFIYLDIKFSSNCDILYIHSVFVNDNILHTRNVRSCDTSLCIRLPDVLGSWNIFAI
jgi:hypothetical protein